MKVGEIHLGQPASRGHVAELGIGALRITAGTSKSAADFRRVGRAGEAGPGYRSCDVPLLLVGGQMYPSTFRQGVGAKEGSNF